MHKILRYSSLVNSKVRSKNLSSGDCWMTLDWKRSWKYLSVCGFYHFRLPWDFLDARICTSCTSGEILDWHSTLAIFGEFFSYVNNFAILQTCSSNSKLIFRNLWSNFGSVKLLGLNQIRQKNLKTFVFIFVHFIFLSMGMVKSWKTEGGERKYFKINKLYEN